MEYKCCEHSGQPAILASTSVMERLLFALALIGVTLACPPVPQPAVTGKGSETAKITIVTSDAYNPSQLQQFMNQFDQTDIEQYSAALGDFDDLSSADVDGNFAYVFILYDCVCNKKCENGTTGTVRGDSTAFVSVVSVASQNFVNQILKPLLGQFGCVKLSFALNQDGGLLFIYTMQNTSCNLGCADGATGKVQGNSMALVKLTPMFGQIGCVQSTSWNVINSNGYFGLEYLVAETNCNL
ncbi:hypothetical protein OSTOST_03116, partial [Ostertagia ostertagi]